MDKNDVFTIFDDIKKRILNIDDRNQDAAQKNVLFTLMPMGLPVSAEQFRNPATPGDQTGANDKETAKRQDAAYQVSRFVDRKLLMDGSGRFSPGSSLISDTWRTIIHSATPAGNLPPPNPATEEHIKAAERVLWVKKNGHKVKTPTYEDYTNYQTAYQRAKQAYSNRYDEASKKEHGLDNWSTVGKDAYAPVEAALAEWQTLGSKEEVEAALNTIAAKGSNAVDYTIKTCRENFDSLQFALAGVGTTYAYTGCLPNNWAEPEDDTWMTYGYRDSQMRTEHSVETRSWGGGGGISFGFFSIGGGGGHKDRTEHQQFNSSASAIRFTYGLVTIDRPWLRTVLLNIKGWGISGQKAGVISDGTATQTKAESDALFLPAIPTQMIVIKKFAIYLGEGSTVLDDLRKSSSGGGRFGWGCFFLGGESSDEDFKTTVSSQMKDGWLEVNGAQVIGWVLEVTPRSPFNDA